MIYKFTREQTFSSTPIRGKATKTVSTTARRISPAYMAAFHKKTVAVDSPPANGYWYSLERALGNISESFGMESSLVLCDTDLRINRSGLMNEYIVVSFYIDGKMVNISFVTQNPGDDEPDVMMLASVKGEGFIFRTRSIKATMRWLSEQFHYVQVQ